MLSSDLTNAPLNRCKSSPTILIDMDRSKYDNHYCIISNRILQEGERIGYFYREPSDGEFDEGMFDSGWVFLAGDEDEDYLDNEDNIEVLTIRELLERDATLEEYLSKPAGSEYEWDESAEEYRAYDDFC